MANERKSMIKVRGGYSDTSGIAPFSTQLQIEEFNDRTRTLLGNELRSILNDAFLGESYTQRYSYRFCKEILAEVFGERNNTGQSYDWKRIFEFKIYDVLQNAVYNEVLDIVWYVCVWTERLVQNHYYGNVYERINRVFEKECVGYRFVDRQIVQNTDALEIQTIESAAQSEFEAPRTQISNAVKYLADRENKDYKTCIKQSISAVESMCNIVTGNKGDTLGEALKELGRNYNLDPQLKEAINKLYAYTNNHGGIRHAEHEEVSEVTFEEAKLCLVICSGILNYLIAEYGKSKV